MMPGSRALSPIIIIARALSVTPLFFVVVVAVVVGKVHPRHSSPGLRQAGRTRCQVGYYNEPRINNSERSINRGILYFFF